MYFNKLTDITDNGLCIGCGLCQSIAGKDKIEINMNTKGQLLPKEIKKIDDKTFHKIVKTCPGTNINGLDSEYIENSSKLDLIWGHYIKLLFSYSADPEIRFKSSTGGVLSALAIHLIETNTVDLIVHTSADPKNPMRNISKISSNKLEILDNTTSRYGPASSLEKIIDILEKNKSFAFIGKPCDIGALRNLSKIDKRVNKKCLYMMTLVCGGISELTKSQDVLDEFKLKEKNLLTFRYRGHGNPGKLFIKSKDEKIHYKSYNDFWQDESKWRVHFRCKICPDAIGESADLAALDVWPGGFPKGEDDGFNGIIIRTKKGNELVQNAVNSGHLICKEKFSINEINNFQPHQVNKKKAILSRLDGIKKLGIPIPEVSNLRLEEITKKNTKEFNEIQKNGIIKRIK